MEIAVLALGCFWGPEIKFSKIDGIKKTEVGYCGGTNALTSYEDILNIFFKIHDPTTLNSQGPDFGTQYRSEIFYDNENQKIVAEKVLNQINENLSDRVVTKISKIYNYCKAEEYHQRYLEKN